MQKPYIVIIGVAMFITALFAITTVHHYNERLEQQGQKSIQLSALDLLEYEVPEFWKKPIKDQEYIEQLDKDEQDLEKGIKLTQLREHKFESGITREELGQMGWTLLHMISATLPEEFDAQFVFKINVFLNLFGQFYPCKECSGHFLQMLKENMYNGKENMNNGNTREDFMQYLCKLHNIVNKRLDKEIYECAKVHDKWGGYCGCSEELQRSIDKYSEKP